MFYHVDRFSAKAGSDYVYFINNFLKNKVVWIVLMQGTYFTHALFWSNATVQNSVWLLYQPTSL